ncbi:MFS transporter [Micromonospora sp. KLBMP9576]|uniref:MFS transporter n=1 Tax=Micromonospora sp. KLBMP9576 TaxID=3424769 RepID=UPI003D8E6DAD
MMTAETERPTKPEEGRQAGLFWRFWAASTVSQTGDAITAVALPLLAVQVLDASSFQVSLITAASFVAWLAIGLPAGVIVQRLPLRGTQVAMDLLRAFALLSIPVAAFLDVLHFWQLVAVALVISFASVVFDVGNSTFLPAIVSKEELTSRNSLMSSTQAVTQVGGPSLGGILVQLVGAVNSLLVDTVSYFVSAVLLWTVPRPARVAPTGSGLSMTKMIKAGWQYVVRHEVIRPCVAAATSTNFVAGALMALTPVFLIRTLDAPAGLVGIVIAAGGVGSFLGATVTTRVARGLGSARTLRWATLVGATLSLLMPLAMPGAGLLLFVIGNAGFSAGVVVLSILTRTHRQATTPADLLPRVMATVRFISWGAVPLGAVTAGIVASTLGNREAFWIICGLAFLTPAVLWGSSLRHRRELA